MKTSENPQILDQLKSNFFQKGYTIISDSCLQKRASQLDQIFTRDFKSRFSENIHANRNLIKAFGRTPDAMSFFNNKKVLDFCKKINISYPIFSGPLVTHYTSRDLTGDGYGLPFHQDYASMGGSLNSLVLWSNLSDINTPTEHSLKVVTGMHDKGILPGNTTNKGYILERQNFEEAERIITIKAGDVLIMSSFTPHRTHFGDDEKTYKISLSIRLDDLNSKEWRKSEYRSAYSTTVDRNLYTKTLNA